MSDVVFALRHVSVVVGGTLLIDDVSWTVRAGERWVVLGSNGAGKTSLLQTVTGELAPTSGAMELLGEPLAGADLDVLLPRVGWCSAALADQLDPTAPVSDVVLTAAYARLWRGDEGYDDVDEDRARALLAQLGCRGLADRCYGTLSEGERKRVQLARALMPDPELLLLDEPAAGLDLGGREALLRRLSRLAADPAAPTLVMVTHHVEEVPAGFTHALLLRGGQVVAAGAVDAVLSAPALSACFGLPLVVERRDGRFSARAGFAGPGLGGGRFPRQDGPVNQLSLGVAMHASIGDHLVVQGHRVGESRREGEVLEVLGAQGAPPYLIRWPDGQENVFFPASDATVLEPTEGHAAHGW